MERDQVITVLRTREPELRAAGILWLSVFGSVARGDQSPNSDIDLLAAFDKTRRLELRLAELLGQRVDLVEEGTLKPRVERMVQAEAVRAF